MEVLNNSSYGMSKVIRYGELKMKIPAINEKMAALIIYGYPEGESANLYNLICNVVAFTYQKAN